VVSNWGQPLPIANMKPIFRGGYFIISWGGLGQCIAHPEKNSWGALAPVASPGFAPMRRMD